MARGLHEVHQRGEAELMDEVQPKCHILSIDRPCRDQKLLYHTVNTARKFICDIKRTSHRHFVCCYVAVPHIPPQKYIVVLKHILTLL